MSKDLKYFCIKCQAVKSAKIVRIYDVNLDPPDKTGKLVEIVKTFTQEIIQTESSTGASKTEKKEFKARQLECNHFISFYTPAFTDHSTDNLNEYETAHLRREIDKSMLGKNAAELEQVILFHCDQYNTLLKIAAKQKQQAKYAIQYLDQLRERYSASLSSEDDKISFETKFAHFLDLRPTTNKTIERERTKIDKDVDKQKAALEAVKALFAKSGYKGKDLFSATKLTESVPEATSEVKQSTVEQTTEQNKTGE